ncbi:MAG: MBL fold metallo-hydrolase [Bacteroidia bacterium]
MKKLYFLFIFFLIAELCFADFLVTNRKTSVKSAPSSQSGIVMQLEEGTTLCLLDDGHQTNNYYKVQSNLFAGEAFIYRTFVRRFTGTPGGANTCTADVNAKIEVRVVDVGAGLCTLIKLPDNKYIVYDAGNKSNATMSQINQFIQPTDKIELMVLSHTDADHIGNAADILRNYTVKKVVWTGYDRSMTSTLAPTGVFTDLESELVNHPSIVNINLNHMDSIITPGVQATFGNVKLTFLCGFGEPLAEWGLSDKAEKINAVSIVMKLEYKGNSVLFCGDAVGRHNGDTDPDALIATEKYLVDHASQFLSSTILIAPHHGADNGSSTDFIEKVNPKKVVFSAGHKFAHPRMTATSRYLTFGINPSSMFRTDRGDDESTNEWDHDRITGCQDNSGDDDIRIELLSNGTFSIKYINPVSACE